MVKIILIKMEGERVSSGQDVANCNVLVCSGADDPFVADEDLSEAMLMFKDLGYQSKLMKFQNTSKYLSSRVE